MNTYINSSFIPKMPPPKEIMEFMQIAGIVEYILNFISILILCAFIYILINKLIKTIINFYEYKFTISTQIDHDEIIKTIDTIITNSITDFVTVNGLYEQFIGEEKEAELRSYVVSALDDQLSDVFMKKMEFVYNKEAIPSLLARRILTTVSIFIAKNNAAIKK